MLYIDPDIDMIDTDTEWVWARDISPTLRAGQPVWEHLRKRIFRSWVENGEVIETPKQLEMFE